MAAKTAVFLVACLFAATAGAQPTTQFLPQTRELSFFQLDRGEAMARYGHPNEMWRYRALRALKLEQTQRALEDFRRAARYGDKFSQHSLSLMHWHGAGTAADRAQAYVWADLAAERGYRDLLLLREKMWMEMNARQRARALLLGEEMYAQYGDDVAKPRMERAMRRALANATGSRVGAATDRIEFLNVGATAGLGLSARDFYEKERWRAGTYWREQDRQWEARVIVRPLEQLPDPQPMP
jgi:hypothetical protein